MNLNRQEKVTSIRAHAMLKARENPGESAKGPEKQQDTEAGDTEKEQKTAAGDAEKKQKTAADDAGKTQESAKTGGVPQAGKPAKKKKRRRWHLHPVAASVLFILFTGLFHMQNVSAAAAAVGDPLTKRMYIAIFIIALFAAFEVPVIFANRFFVLHRLFLWCGLTFGFFFIAVMPGLSGPDDASHYITAYRLSSHIVGTEDLTDAGLIAVRKRDYPVEDLNGVKTPEIPDDTEEEPQVFGSPVTNATYRTMVDWEQRYAQGEDRNELVSSALPDVQTTPVMYLPQAVGIAVARALNLGTIALLILGKLMNLLVFLALVTAAIRITPVGKEIFFGVSLLPMTMHLAASFSYDAGIIGTIFLFTALTLRAAFGETEVNWAKLTILLAVLAAVFAPCKLIYLIVAALPIFLIPEDKLGGSRNKAVACALILLCALASTTAVNGRIIRAYVNAPATMTEEAEEPGEKSPIVQDVQNAATILTGRDFSSLGAESAASGGESAAQGTGSVSDETGIIPERAGYSAMDLMIHPVYTLRMIFNTLSLQGGELVGGLIGMHLGNLDPLLGTPFFAAVLFAAGLILLCVLQPEEKDPLTGGNKACCAVFFLLIVFAASCAMMISWTPRGSSIIEGVQGRYFLPVLPLLMLAVRGNRLSVRDIPRRAVLSWFVILDIYTILRILALAAMRI